MGINSPITWGVNCLNNRDSYNRNAGLVLNEDLALFVVDANVSVRMRICSDPHEAQDAELLRLAFEVKRRVAHTCA